MGIPRLQHQDRVDRRHWFFERRVFAEFASNLLARPNYYRGQGKGENAAGNDLYIKFSDVQVDYDHYHLILSIHFIDPKTNSEIATVPVRPYYGNDWGRRNYLKAALDEVGTKLGVEVTGELQGKKKK